MSNIEDSQENGSEEIDNQLIEIKLSERTTVKIKDLNGRECRVADRINGLDRQTIGYTRALCSVREMNGKSVRPMSGPANVEALAQKLNSREYEKLATEFATRFLLDGEELALEVGND